MFSATISDDVLVEQVRQGETEALGELYQRHAVLVKRALYRYARVIDEPEIEELCQEVFLKLMAPGLRYQAQGKFRSWIYGLAVNMARQWRRRQGIISRLFRPLNRNSGWELVSSHSSPEATLSAREVVLQAMQRLPKNLREVLILYEIEGFSGQECAEILGIKQGAVWTRLHRARQKIIDAERSTPTNSLVSEKSNESV
jgi:RNA polymerase sigma-70 factor (ECF subfamily)